MLQMVAELGKVVTGWVSQTKGLLMSQTKGVAAAWGMLFTGHLLRCAKV